MKSPNKHWWQNYVPSYANNPAKLAWQLLTDKKPAARSAMWMAAAGIVASPLDVCLSVLERRLYRTAPISKNSIILVCGPPRSGTTLVAQFLINNLDVAYLNNLTSIFPRSPIYANKAFGRVARLKKGNYDAFYGKSSGLAGANDALYIWDRWLGNKRENVPGKLVPGSGDRMRRFFGAFDQLYDLALVNKVNKLNTCANLVADELPNTRFICIRRDPAYLAQSLYVARSKIVGNQYVAYGVQHQPASADPVEDVCLQVAYHEKISSQQQRELGSERFSIVSYENFCSRPKQFLEWFLSQESGLSLRRNSENPEEFKISRARQVSDKIFTRIEQNLERLNVARPHSTQF